MSEERTITETELAEFFQRKHYAGLHAQGIVDDIVAHRERAWEYGDVVKSRRGHFYRRTGDGKWNRFGEPGSYTHSFPLRPLEFIGNDWGLGVE